jgi:SAM-dependent methyltransferase
VTPATQYRTDANLRARQSLWTTSDPPLDLMSWVLDLAGLAGTERVLDVGCGNGTYLTGLVARGHRGDVVGVDTSPGMLRAVPVPGPLVVGDVQRLPFTTGAFDVVLAPHMLYHVPDRRGAAAELRRVLRQGGVAVVVTNGRGNHAELRDAVEAAAGGGWRWERPSDTEFSLENGAEQLSDAFVHVERVDTPPRQMVVTDPDGVAAYIESVRDHYEHQLPPGRWDHVVAEGRRRTAEAVAAHGALRISTSVGAFVCR